MPDTRGNSGSWNTKIRGAGFASALLSDRGGHYLLMPAMQATVASILGERRVRPRHEYWVVVRFTHEGVQHVGMSVDVSLGGMCLRSDTVGFEVGLRFPLEFDVPLLRNPVAVQGELRWVDEARGVCGVQFITGLRAREVWAIQQLVLPPTLL